MREFWMRCCWTVLCLVFFHVQQAQAATERDFTVNGVNVKAWLPSGKTDKLPVIIFSHGFHGCNTQSTFLTKALADEGYAVFAPNHLDAACHKFMRMMKRPEEPFRETEHWTDSTYNDRLQSIRKLLDGLQRSPQFDSLDWNHVGMAGHSLGGYTALAMAGGWSTWRDSRIKAVLALSPYAEPFVYNDTISKLKVPVMFQGGTRDIGITPTLNRNNGAYDQAPRPKYYVELDGASHFAWTDLRATYHDTIVKYSIAFFNHALKGKPFPESLTKPPKDVAGLRIDQDALEPLRSHPETGRMVRARPKPPSQF